jgi:hypothetical protein
MARSNKAKWFLAVGAILVLLCVCGAAAFVFTTFTSNKYIAAAGLPNPDSGYQTGTIYGYDVWVWECYQNKHIVLWRTSAEFTAGQYTREEAACGERTLIEVKLQGEQKRVRDPKNFW